MTKLVTPTDFENAYNVRAYGAVGDGTANDSPAIQLALDAAAASVSSNGGALVLIPPGKYKLNTQLVIQANTTLMAYGAYLFQGNNNYLLVNDTAATETVYGGQSNITVMGGIWDGKGHTVAADVSLNVMGFYHAHNITVRDVVIRNVPSFHAIEFNSIDGGIIDNCRFEGFKDTTTGLTRFFSEAIQLDKATNDNTPCKNILVQNCYQGPAIDGSALSFFGRLVGSHNDTLGIYFTNIRIINNISDGSIDNGIQTYSWTESVVSGNIIRNAGAVGIRISGNANNPVENLTIANNIILNSTTAGIEMNGNATRTLSNAVFSNNIFTDCGASTPVLWAKNCIGCTFSGNTINGGGNIGINIDNGNSNNCSGNTINNAGHDSIRLGDSTSNNIVSNNIINTTPQRGIYLTGAGSGNTVMSNYVINAGTALGTAGVIEASSTVGANNAFIGNRAIKGTGTSTAGIRTVSGGPTTTTVLGNSLRGWSITYTTAYAFGAAVDDDIAATTTANNTLA